MDQKIHSGNKKGVVSYARMDNSGNSGWFSVKIVDIKFVTQQQLVRRLTEYFCWIFERLHELDEFYLYSARNQIRVKFLWEKIEKNFPAVIRASMSLVLFVKVFALGRGTIVDSGTTDTYLPQIIAKKFMENFSKITGGIQFSQGNIPLQAVI